MPAGKLGLENHVVSVDLMLWSSDVTNVIKNDEEIDTLEVILDDKQSALESTQEVVNDNPEKIVRLVKAVKCSSDHEEKQQPSLWG